MNTCQNCNSEISSNFCQNCGYPREPKRINRQYIIEEVRSVLNFEKGFFYTIKELFLRPGDTIRNYILGDRRKIVKPIVFLIVTSLVYTITQRLLNFEAGLIQYNVENSGEIPLVIRSYEWFSANYGYANILIVIFIAFWIKMLYRKHSYNYYEIYILLCFIMGNSILLYTLLGTIESLTNYPIFQIGIILSLLYTTWAIGQFFGKRNKMNYVKGLLSYILGILSCLAVFVAIIIGVEMLL